MWNEEESMKIRPLSRKGTLSVRKGSASESVRNFLNVMASENFETFYIEEYMHAIKHAIFACCFLVLLLFALDTVQASPTPILLAQLSVRIVTCLIGVFCAITLEKLFKGRELMLVTFFACSTVTLLIFASPSILQQIMRYDELLDIETDSSTLLAIVLVIIAGPVFFRLLTVHSFILGFYSVVCYSVVYTTIPQNLSKSYLITNILMLLLAACIVLVGSRQAEISVRRFHRNKIGVRNEYRKVKNELMQLRDKDSDKLNPAEWYDEETKMEKLLTTLQSLKAKLPFDAHHEIDSIISQLLNNNTTVWSTDLPSQILSGRKGMDQKVQEWLLQTLDPQDERARARRLSISNLELATHPEGANSLIHRARISAARGSHRKSITQDKYAINRENEDATENQSKTNRNSQRSMSVMEQLETYESELLRCLAHIHTWDFNVFRLEQISQNQPLFACTHFLLSYHDLFSTGINQSKWSTYIAAVEAAYNAKRNPYHNSTHAADVVSTLNYFLMTPKLNKHVLEHEIFVAFVAGAVHDVAHEGLNNAFLIATKHDLATRYNDQSVLENHHCAVAFQLMKRENCSILDFLVPEKYKRARNMIIQMVLDTDLAKHFDSVGRFRARLSDQSKPASPPVTEGKNMPKDRVVVPPNRIERFHSDTIGMKGLNQRIASKFRNMNSARAETEQDQPSRTTSPLTHSLSDGIDPNDPDDKLLLLRMATKAADIAHPCKPRQLHLCWTARVTREFYNQGDQERELGLPVTPLFDREKSAISNSQQGFIKFIVRPLFEVWVQYLESPNVDRECLQQLVDNQNFWENWTGDESDVLNADKETLRLDARPKSPLPVNTSGMNAMPMGTGLVLDQSHNRYFTASDRLPDVLSSQINQDDSLLNLRANPSEEALKAKREAQARAMGDVEDGSKSNAEMAPSLMIVEKKEQACSDLGDSRSQNRINSQKNISIEDCLALKDAHIAPISNRSVKQLPPLNTNHVIHHDPVTLSVLPQISPSDLHSDDEVSHEPQLSGSNEKEVSG